MLPTIDSAGFPLVLITYPAHMTPEEADAYGQELGEVFTRGRVATVVDIRALDSSVVTPTDRKYLAQVVDRVTKAHPGALVAESIVLDSAILRGLYIAYSWLRSDQSYPSRAFGSVDEARAWVLKQLQEAGLVER